MTVKTTAHCRQFGDYSAARLYLRHLQRHGYGAVLQALGGLWAVYWSRRG